MSVNFHSVSNSQLKSQLEQLARSERKITAQVIEHIAEVERRRLHLEWGYSSMFDYLIRCLSYSESAAYRRIQAARALRQMPILAENLEDGSLKLSQVAQVQTALKQEERETGQKVSIERKREVFAKLENKSGFETKKIIAQEIGNAQGPDKEFLVDLNLKVSEEVFENLKRIKELYSHIDPHADWAGVIALMAKDVLKKRDPLVKKERNNKVTQRFAATAVTKKVDIGRKPIPARVKRMVFQRDKGKCQYKAKNGHMCGSEFQTQVDHIRPRYIDGSNEPENLRVLCRDHNIYIYIYIYIYESGI